MVVKAVKIAVKIAKHLPKGAVKKTAKVAVKAIPYIIKKSI